MIRHSNPHQRTHTQGFTLVELMVAMAFVSMLLLAIAFVVIQITGIYNRGVTIKAVNQAGRSIVEDMKRAIGASSPDSIVYTPISNANVVQGGRLCTGVYSYVWTIGKYIDDTSNWVNKYKNDDAYPNASTKPIRLIKVRDNGGQYCDAAGGVVDIVPEDATELISTSDGATNNFLDTNLTIQAFDIEQVTDNASIGSALYRVSLLISNADQEAIDTVSGNCKPPTDSSANNDFCAVNEFNFTVRAGGKGGQ